MCSKSQGYYQGKEISCQFCDGKVHPIESRSIAYVNGEAVEYWKVENYCDGCGIVTETPTQIRANHLAKEAAYSRFI